MKKIFRKVENQQKCKKWQESRKSVKMQNIIMKLKNSRKIDGSKAQNQQKSRISVEMEKIFQNVINCRNVENQQKSRK